MSYIRSVQLLSDTQIMRLKSFTIPSSGEIAITYPVDITNVSAINVAATSAATNNSSGCLVGYGADIDSGLGIFIASSNYEGKPIKVTPTGWKIKGTEGDIIIVAFFGTAVV